MSNGFLSLKEKGKKSQFDDDGLWIKNNYYRVRFYLQLRDDRGGPTPLTSTRTINQWV